MNGIRYHAIGSEIFLKGMRRVVCYGESIYPDQFKAESNALAQEVAKNLNLELEAIDKDETIKEGERK